MSNNKDKDLIVIKSKSLCRALGFPSNFQLDITLLLPLDSGSSPFPKSHWIHHHHQPFSRHLWLTETSSLQLLVSGVAWRSSFFLKSMSRLILPLHSFLPSFQSPRVKSRLCYPSCQHPRALECALPEGRHQDLCYALHPHTPLQLAPGKHWYTHWWMKERKRWKEG